MPGTVPGGRGPAERARPATTANTEHPVAKTTVTFDSAGIPLAGHLYTPATPPTPPTRRPRGPRSSSATPAPA